MRWTKLIYGGLLWASVAFAVSRVGGGSVANTEEGLDSLQIPAVFQQGSDIYPNGDVRLHGPTMIGAGPGSIPQEEMLNLFLLSNSMPSLKGVTDRNIFDRQFLGLGWTQVQTANPCLEAVEIVSSNSYNMVVSWGNGLGLVLSGPDTDDIVDGIQNAVKSIAVTPGACAWK
jgi:hypothetical protein